MQKEARKVRCTVLHGWRSSSTETPRNDGYFAPVTARISDEKAGIEDRKRTSGGVFVAVDCKLGAVVGTEDGAVESILGKN